MMRTFSFGILFVSVCLGCVQLAVYLPQLPDRVASHFGANGQPDGFSSRGSFSVLMWVLYLVIPASMVAASQMARVLPPSMVNVPNREYWLSDDRRDSTLQYMEMVVAWISVATQWLLMGVFHLTFQANMSEQPLNERWAYGMLATYLIAVFGCCGHLYWRFRLPAEARESNELKPRQNF